MADPLTCDTIVYALGAALTAVAGWAAKVQRDVIVSQREDAKRAEELIHELMRERRDDRS